MTEPFRVDVESQAQALLDFERAPISLGLYPLVRDRHDRIVLTGMSGSHFAALPSWRRLVSRGKAAWWIDTGSLLGSPELITPDSLLIATSRSGRREEAVVLMQKFDETTRPAAIVAITDDLASPLVECADCEILLRSRSAGGLKGFLNTLAAHDYLASLILSEDSADLSSTAHIVAATTYQSVLGEVAAGVVANPESKLAYIGFREYAATSLYAGLLTTQTTGIAAKGYVGAQFRQGPLQRADTNLTAVLFSGHAPLANVATGRLARDLVAAGSTVVVVGDADAPGAIDIPSPATHISAQVAHGVVIAEHFVSALATESISLTLPDRGVPVAGNKGVIGYG
jgi:fructoselysine-6-P-deglycase FrlB-like protein